MNCIYYVFLLNRLSNNHKGKATFYKMWLKLQWWACKVNIILYVKHSFEVNYSKSSNIVK